MEELFPLFAGLFGVNNINGTTLMSQNQGTAVNLNSAAVSIGSTVVAVTDNHIINSGRVTFFIVASQGLFTDNVTNRPNTIVQNPPPTGSANAIEQAPNMQI